MTTLIIVASFLALVLVGALIAVRISSRRATARRAARTQGAANPATGANPPAAGQNQPAATPTPPPARPRLQWWDPRIWKSVGHLIIGIVVAIALWQAWQLSKQHVNDYTVDSPTENRNITITTNWWVKDIPFGYNIDFAPTTDDMGWEVKVNDNPKVYLRPPVNSPEYTPVDYGQNLKKVWVRVSPTNRVARTGKLQYVIK
ncbi:MAG: hypothetical protein V4481_01865 [Patescibacteria group bacterium]